VGAPPKHTQTAGLVQTIHMTACGLVMFRLDFCRFARLLLHNSMACNGVDFDHSKSYMAVVQR